MMGIATHICITKNKQLLIWWANTEQIEAVRIPRAMPPRLWRRKLPKGPGLRQNLM